MDPLSIVAGSTSLVAAAIKAGFLIDNAISQTKSVDQDLQSLRNEVSALQSGLEAIEFTFQGDDVAAMCRDRSNSARLDKLFSCLDKVLIDCVSTLDDLTTTFESASSGRLVRGFLRQPVKALKLANRYPKIRRLRNEIHGYVASMQLTLEMVSISLTIQSSNFGLGIGEQITALEKRISDLTDIILSERTLRTNVTGSSKSDEQVSAEKIKTWEEVATSATTLVSIASVYSKSDAGSVAGPSSAQNRPQFGSVLGINDQRIEEINSWRGNPGDEDHPVKTLFYTRKTLAERDLLARNYPQAEERLRKCLATGTIVAELPLQELFEMKIALSTACLEQGKHDAAEATLSQAAEPADLQESQLLRVEHMRAVVQYRFSAPDLALKHAEKAWNGLYKLKSTQTTSFYNTTQLLVRIHRSLNDESEAETYQSFLPNNFVDETSSLALFEDLEDRTIQVHTAKISALAFSHDGRRVASGSMDHDVLVCDVRTGSEVLKLEGHTHWVQAVSFSPDGLLVASGCMNKQVRLWDTKGGSARHAFSGHDGYVETVAFSPDGRILASGGDYGNIRLWDVRQNSAIGVLMYEGSTTSCIAFSPNGLLIAAATLGVYSHLWAVKSRSKVEQICVPTSYKSKRYDGWQHFTSVAFSPDGSLLAWGSSSSTIQIWDIKNKAWIASLDCKSDEVKCVAFTLDGHNIVSICSASVLLYNFRRDSSKQLYGRICSDVQEITACAISVDCKTIAFSIKEGDPDSDSEGDTDIESHGINIRHLKLPV